jgi:hypothetical protein
MRPAPDRSGRRVAALIGLCAGLLLTGCVQRRMTITTEPPGARVWINDVEIGTTPAETDFSFYGWYDIRVEHPDFEPIATEREAHAPVWEWPGLDLVAELLPITFDNNVEWHFDLVPSPETYVPADELERELVERARAMRATIGATTD